MDNVKCRCVILPCPAVCKGRAEPCAAADRGFAWFPESVKSWRQPVLFGSLERVCCAPTPWVPQHSIHPGSLPPSQPVSWVLSSFSPILYENNRIGRGCHFPSAVTSIPEWMWGWLLSLKWTSSSFKHCPAPSTLTPDFSLFTECNFMLEREFSCSLCSKQAI